MEISRESVWPSLILCVEAPHARDQAIVSLESMSAQACLLGIGQPGSSLISGKVVDMKKKRKKKAILDSRIAGY